DAQGNAAAGSANTNAISDTRGGEFYVISQAAAGVVQAPGPFNANATASGNASALENWTLSGDTHFSVALDSQSDFDGTASSANATATFSGGGGASSGILSAGTYSMLTSASSNAGASESGAQTGAANAEAMGRVTFAPVGSPTLVRGTITAGGLAQPGLIVEAFDGTTLIDSALTGDDGSYLLPEVLVAATLRVRDPNGGFQTLETSVLAPPAVFDTNLPPLVVPALPLPFAGLLVVGLVLGARLRSGR
ncbi:MAG: hypothetical protein AAF513_13480, partial [Pseudomonadota bacterium]